MLEEGGGALCVEGNILDIVAAFGLRKSPKRSGPVRDGLSGVAVNGSNGSAKDKRHTLLALLEKGLTEEEEEVTHGKDKDWHVWGGLNGCGPRWLCQQTGSVPPTRGSVSY